MKQLLIALGCLSLCSCSCLDFSQLNLSDSNNENEVYVEGVSGHRETEYAVVVSHTYWFPDPQVNDGVASDTLRTNSVSTIKHPYFSNDIPFRRGTYPKKVIATSVVVKPVPTPTPPKERK